MFNSAKIVFAAFLTVVFMSIAPFTAFATEGGGGAYGNGAEDSMSGNVPGPGFWFINYMNYYHSDEFKDNNGDTLLGKDQFEVTTLANIFRFAYTSNVQILGGNLGGYLLVPLVYADVKTPAGSDTNEGLGDMTISPFISWHTKNFHWAVAFDVTMPTGDYDKNEVANLGRNYFTFEPLVAFTYLADNGFEFTGKLMYDINTENNDTNYKSGQELHADYFAGYHAGPWTFGLNGYLYKQVTDDELNGNKVKDNRGQIMAAGPMVSYFFKGQSIVLKYQKEFEAENKSEGEKVWLKYFVHF